ncbi:class I SAM-dependent methyltransferase [Singulisphaera rosea]
MELLRDAELERSSVVANCRMNRERNLVGSNGYGKELGFDPLGFLKERAAAGRRIAWLDLCCGTGRALIQAAKAVEAEALDVEIVGVDLVGRFDRVESRLGCLRLVEASLSVWRPDRRFDLITCVHGLHYVGDKLGLVARVASWLVEDGQFVANLDLKNLKVADDPEDRRLLDDLRRSGLVFHRRHRRLVCRGKTMVDLHYRYLGAGDEAGPNYTGQPAVNSHYERGSDLIV